MATDLLIDTYTGGEQFWVSPVTTDPSDILRDALSRVEPAKHPGGYYSADGDCVFLYIEDSPYLRDRIDSLLTVYRNLEDRSRVIGLQVKGIKRLTKKGIITDLLIDTYLRLYCMSRSRQGIIRPLTWWERASWILLQRWHGYWGYR